MGSEAKHRVFVRAHDRDAELYSIFERANGDLIISKKMNFYSDSPTSGGLPKMKQHRFSVHRSLGSNVPARTVKTTIETSRGPKDAAAFVKCDMLRFLWPVDCHLHSNLDFEAFTMKSRKKDTPVRLGSYQPSLCAIITHLYVADRGVFRLNMTWDWPINCVISFEFFEILVVASFVPIPSIPKGVSRLVATGKNSMGVKASVSGEGSYPFRLEKLSDEIATSSLQLADMLRQRIVFRAFKLGLAASAPMKWINDSCLNIQPLPTDLDCADAMILRDHIINVPDAPPRSFSPELKSPGLFPII